MEICNRFHLVNQSYINSSNRVHSKSSSNISPGKHQDYIMRDKYRQLARQALERAQEFRNHKEATHDYVKGIEPFMQRDL